MTPELRDLIVRELTEHRLMTLATNRPDGWPQATTVCYVNDGLSIYCFVARVGQKYANIRRDDRVSIAIAGDFSTPSNIKGLSLAGRARLVDDRVEYDRVHALLMQRFPEYATWPKPNPALASLFKITPAIVSILDYSKGFGHSDLVTISPSDLKGGAEPRRHDWLGWAR